MRIGPPKYPKERVEQFKISSLFKSILIDPTKALSTEESIGKMDFSRGVMKFY